MQAPNLCQVSECQMSEWLPRKEKLFFLLSVSLFVEHISQIRELLFIMSDMGKEKKNSVKVCEVCQLA